MGLAKVVTDRRPLVSIEAVERTAGIGPRSKPDKYPPTTTGFITWCGFYCFLGRLPALGRVDDLLRSNNSRVSSQVYSQIRQFHEYQISSSQVTCTGFGVSIHCSHRSIDTSMKGPGDLPRLRLSSALLYKSAGRPVAQTHEILTMLKPKRSCCCVCCFYV